MPKVGIVQLLTPIRDCGTIFDRVHAHWFINAEMSYFIRLCMDYEDSIGSNRTGYGSKWQTDGLSSSKGTWLNDSGSLSLQVK